MKSSHLSSLTGLLILLFVPVTHSLVIDSFLTAQQPSTEGTGDAGPNDVTPAPETISGNRFFGIDGVTASASLGNGQLQCQLTGREDEADNCGLVYFAPQPVDLTQNGQNNGISFFVSQVSGVVDALIIVSSEDGSLSAVGAIEGLNVGENIIMLDELIPIPPFGPAPDYTAVSDILIAFEPPNDTGTTQVTLDLIETSDGDGPAGGGQMLMLGNRNTSTFFDPARDGEGVQFVVLPDDQTVVMTWYTYLNGEQVWLIGASTFTQNPTVFELTITDGATFGEDFDPDSVNRTVWGTVTVNLTDCNTLTLDATPQAPQFLPVTLDLTRVLPVDCTTLSQLPGNTGNTVNFENSGTYFNPMRDGEGVQITLEANEQTLIATWYTYLNGRQVWLIGAGDVDQDQVTMDVTVTQGTGFGGDFDPAEVIRTQWGAWQIRFIDCNTIELTANPILPAYQPITLEMTKIAGAECEL